MVNRSVKVIGVRGTAQAGHLVEGDTIHLEISRPRLSWSGVVGDYGLSWTLNWDAYGIFRERPGGQQVFGSWVPSSFISMLLCYLLLIPFVVLEAHFGIWQKLSEVVRRPTYRFLHFSCGSYCELNILSQTFCLRLFWKYPGIHLALGHPHYFPVEG